MQATFWQSVHRTRSPVATVWQTAMVATVFLLNIAVTWAHDNEVLDHMRGPHGGMLRAAGAFHFELVVGKGELRVWVMDHGNQPQSVEGASGTASVLDGSARVTVSLVPVGVNALVAKDMRIQTSDGSKVALTVSLKGQEPLVTRFAMDAGKNAVDAGHETIHQHESH